MGNKINAKLGLKASSRKRAATHGRLVASGLRCPDCGHRWILKSVSERAPAAFWCGWCSHFFDECSR